MKGNGIKDRFKDLVRTKDNRLKCTNQEFLNRQKGIVKDVLSRL